MNTKGQGALEYLLLIGGAVLVAAIVIALLVGLPGSAGVDPADKAYCANLANFGLCKDTARGTGFCCAFKTDGVEAAKAADFSYCTWKSVACVATAP